MKPISMSTASAIPPLLPASSVDWIIAPASMKSRKLVDLGEAGQVDGAAGAADLDREQQRREDEDRRDELRAAEGLLDRARAERGDDARASFKPAPGLAAVASTSGVGAGLLRALEVLAGLVDEDVVERRLDEVQRLDQDPGLVERADDRRDRRGAVSTTSTISFPSLARQRLAEALEHVLQSVARAVGEHSSSRGWPTSALSDVGRALGDDPAGADDPDAVGELVGLLEVLGGQEDGRALVVELRRPPPRSPCG